MPRRRVPARPVGPAAQRRRRRRYEERCDRSRVDRSQGDAGSDHAKARRALPALRLLASRRVHHSGPFGRGARARAVRAASAVVRGQVLRAECRARARRSVTHGASTRRMNTGERRALWHYRLRGYRIIGTNVLAGRNELDLIVRRGSRLTFVEVKQRRSKGFGGAVGAVRCREAASSAPRRARLALAQPTARLRAGGVRGGDGRRRPPRPGSRRRSTTSLRGMAPEIGPIAT